MKKLILLLVVMTLCLATVLAFASPPVDKKSETELAMTSATAPGTDSLGVGQNIYAEKGFKETATTLATSSVGITGQNTFQNAKYNNDMARQLSPAEVIGMNPAITIMARPAIYRDTGHHPPLLVICFLAATEDAAPMAQLRL